jgi:hypothetical protein
LKTPKNKDIKINEGHKMIHCTFTEIKSSSIGLVEDLDIIVILKSLWIATKISFHTWSGLIADFQNLPRSMNLGIYGAQIEVVRSSDRERNMSLSLPIEDPQI